MKYLSLTMLALWLIPSAGYAADGENLEVDCKDKSSEFAASLVSANLTNGDEAAIKKEALTFCQSIVTNAEKARAADANSEFSEWLINGEQAEKAGNKRLKNRLR
jgi:hypothetical protein